MNQTIKSRHDKPLQPFNNSSVWRFLGWWVFGNMIGTGLGVTIGLIEATHTLAVYVGVSLWVIVGLVVGVTQRLVLQQQIYADKWVWASIAGWTVGGVLGGHNGIDWAIVGVLVGGMQWFVLRRCVYPAGWWVLANAVGLIFGASVGWSIRFTSRWTLFKTIVAIDPHLFEIVDWAVAGIVGGAISGIITGFWLAWLLSLRQSSIEHKPLFELMGKR